MIKLAMPKVHKFLLNNKLKSKILLQVHDELLFESPHDEVELIKKEVPLLMTSSFEKLISMSVPIKVDVGIGKSWADAH